MTCLSILLLFMSNKAGMPGNSQGWVLYGKNMPFYTWYQKEYKDKEGFIAVEYIAAAKSINDLENKRLNPYGKCVDSGQEYTVFKLKSKIK